MPVVIVLVVVVVRYAPPWIANTDGLQGRYKAEELSRARTAILASLAGVIALAGATVTWRSYVLSRSGQITERFSGAVQQLGSESVDVRVGGIYALERILKDSSDDHPAVVELLSEYVRINATWPTPADVDADDDDDRPWSPGDPQLRDLPPFERPASRAPIQAAMTVICRRETRNDTARIDLRSSDLRRLDLDRARLSRSKLSRSNLERAWLAEALLDEASLSDCRLDDAAMWAAHLERTRMQRARLRYAWLEAAHLDGASLVAAQLQRADLRRARLVDADLTDAGLDEANLSGADLSQANLEGASLVGVIWDAETSWPAGYEAPPSAPPREMPPPVFEKAW